MKKIISVLLCVCLLTVALCSAALAAGCGDVDNTGKIDAADARLILRASVKLEEFSAEQNARADLDFDGQVTAADARLALRYSVGLELFNGNFYANEYEALRGGNFVSKIRAVFDDAVLDSIVGIVPGSVLTVSFTEEMTAAVLLTGSGNFLIYDEVGQYIKLTPAICEQLGIDLSAIESLLFTADEYPPLADAVDHGTITEDNGETYDYYVLETDNGYITVLMSGKKLAAIIYSDWNGITQETDYFVDFSVFVDSDYMRVPEGYTEITL